MGCAPSSSGRRRRRSTEKREKNDGKEKRMVYSVKNVNDDGKTLFSGKIEIADGKLILRGKRDKKCKSPVVWPLTTVRRYGYERGMFCIETGHGSPTGDGVFAFQCKQAKCFFDDVQATLKTDSAAANSTSSNDENADENNCGDSGDETKNAAEAEAEAEAEADDRFDDYMTLRAPPAPAEYHVTYTKLEFVPASKSPGKKKAVCADYEANGGGYTVIDFEKTQGVSRKMLRRNDDAGTRKTRHDSDAVDP